MCVTGSGLGGGAAILQTKHSREGRQEKAWLTEELREVPWGWCAGFKCAGGGML